MLREEGLKYKTKEKRRTKGPSHLAIEKTTE